MPTLNARRSVWISASLCGIVLAAALGAAPAAPTKGDAATTAAEKIRKELDQVLSVDIDGQSLHLAINQLREQTKINFVLDRMLIAQMGIDPDQTEVKLKLKDVKLKSVLRSLLTQYNLSYGIVDDTVVISSEEGVASRQMRDGVSIDLEKAEFAKALRQLAKETSTNLVIDSRVAKDATGPITLQLDDVPLENAVRLMAESVNLRPVRVGNVLFVCSKTIATELKADPDINPQPPNVRMAPDGTGLMIGPGGLGGFAGPPPGAAAPAIVPLPAATVPSVAPKADDTKPVPADKGDTPKTDPKKDG